MTKSVKRLIVTIGILSLISGIYLAFTGSDFSEYFPGIFLGATLVGSVFIYEGKDSTNRNH
jgi:hypothetical protein